MMWECLLHSSWEGLRLIDVAIGRLAVILVDWVFFCCIRRWPLLVASDLARCLVTSSEAVMAKLNCSTQKGGWWGAEDASTEKGWEVLLGADILDGPTCRMASSSRSSSCVQWWRQWGFWRQWDISDQRRSTMTSDR